VAKSQGTASFDFESDSAEGSWERVCLPRYRHLAGGTCEPQCSPRMRFVRSRRPGGEAYAQRVPSHCQRIQATYIPWRSQRLAVRGRKALFSGTECSESDLINCRCSSRSCTLILTPRCSSRPCGIPAYARPHTHTPLIWHGCSSRTLRCFTNDSPWI